MAENHHEAVGRAAADDRTTPASRQIGVHEERLRLFASAVLQSLSVPERDAALVADSLVRADLWGHQSHGVMRLPWYVSRIRAGSMKALTNTRVVVDSGPLAILDGNDGIGQVLANQAAHEAVDRAKQHGVGVVGVRNSNHFGTAAYFTRMGADDGCVSLLTTNASPAMAPWGGRVKTVGTNPWSIAAPAGKYGIAVMDIANTAVARGKIYLAQQQGLPIPEGWALNAEGDATTDPTSAIGGLVLPMAGHKGYAISFMMDILSGVFTGAGSGTSVGGPYEAGRRSRCGHLFVALNVESVIPLGEFNSKVENLIDSVKEVPTAPGFAEVLYPGELEARNERKAANEGLYLPAKTVVDLEEVAGETNVPIDIQAEMVTE